MTTKKTVETVEYEYDGQGRVTKETRTIVETDNPAPDPATPPQVDASSVKGGDEERPKLTAGSHLADSSKAFGFSYRRPETHVLLP